MQDCLTTRETQREKMHCILTKTRSGFIPGDPQTETWFKKIKIGEDVRGNFKRYRNPAFHRKYMALLNIAFDIWEPGEIDYKYGVPEKNFDRFRKDVAILAGFYEPVIRLDGSVRIEPKSISFANMDQDEFQELYSKTIDVLIKHVYNLKSTPEQIEETVRKYLEFV